MFKKNLAAYGPIVVRCGNSLGKLRTGKEYSLEKRNCSILGEFPDVKEAVSVVVV